jgi:UDP-N-acetylmuramate--alanine ligase
VFESGTRVHIIGVGGAGMSGVARLLRDLGCVVSGSDAAPSATLQALAAEGLDVYAGTSAKRASQAAVVLWSPAVDRSNLEMAAARDAGAQLVARAELLSALSNQLSVIGLTGTHGKTTATSMLVHIFAAAGRPAGRLLGVPVLGVGANGAAVGHELIMEVDESYGTFTAMSPQALGVLNVEADHLDYYGTVANLEEAFAALVERTSGPVVYFADDPGARRVTAGHAGALGVGAHEGAVRLHDVTLSARGASWRLDGGDISLALTMTVTGAHNVANASVAATLAHQLGVGNEAIAAGLGNFVGAPRRFQLWGKCAGAAVYEDYAHLPGELRATIGAAHDAGYQRLAAVFQPHRITRTVNLLEEFVDAFEGVTHLVVTDIYTAGEENPNGVTGQVLADRVHAAHPTLHVTYAPTLAQAEDALAALAANVDAILVLGAGDVGTIAANLTGRGQ